MTSVIEINFAGQALQLDPSGALWWPSRRILVVSDLHFEKSTFLAQHGSAIAPYDTQAVALERLEALVRRYQPRELLLLGDSFHDRQAWARMDSGLQQRLLALAAQVEICRWLEGNHDAALSTQALHFEKHHTVDGVFFTHEPETDITLPQIMGHYHPKASIGVKGMYVRGPCFVVTQRVLIMPAFGTYTGGLDIRHEVLRELIGKDAAQYYLLHKQSIYPVPSKR